MNHAETPAFQPDANDILGDVFNVLSDISTDLRAVLNHLNHLETRGDDR